MTEDEILSSVSAIIMEYAGSKDGTVDSIRVATAVGLIEAICQSAKSNIIVETYGDE